MNVIIYDYKEYDNTVVLKEVKQIVKNDEEHITIIFESGDYISYHIGDINYIKVMWGNYVKDKTW